MRKIKSVAVRQGPTCTFEVLYRAEYIGMVRLAFTLVGSNAEAEEIVTHAMRKEIVSMNRLEHQIVGASNRRAADRGRASVLAATSTTDRPPSNSISQPLELDSHPDCGPGP